MQPIRSERFAELYDLCTPIHPDDIEFWKARIPHPEAQILELGCGTGRVLLPLAERCKEIVGVDESEAMLRRAQARLETADLPPEHARVVRGDITNFEVGKYFDRIIAPFRPFQNLTSAGEIDGFFQCVRRHLKNDGSAILTAFNPYATPEDLRRIWEDHEEAKENDIPMDNGGRIEVWCRRTRVTPDPLVIHPTLIYKVYDPKGALVDETRQDIDMRCFYPEELISVIRSSGFEIRNRWGGYNGEPYGDGPELIVEFVKDNSHKDYAKPAIEK